MGVAIPPVVAGISEGDRSSLFVREAGLVLAVWQSLR